MKTYWTVAALVLTVLAGTSPAPAQEVRTAPRAHVRYDGDHLSPDFHRSRRAAVRDALPADAVAVFFGAPRRTRSNDTDFEYRQDSDFYYLTGSVEPGSALLLAPSGVEVDGDVVREVLFVPPRNPMLETWLGRRFGAEGAREVLGVEAVVENGRFEEIVAPLLADPSRPTYHLPLPEGVEADSPLAEQLTVFRREVRLVADGEAGTAGSAAAAPDGETLRRVLSGLREIKTEEETRLLRKAIDITVLAHREVMEQVEPGWAEYEIEALVEYTFKRMGAEYTGFPSIVGSGGNSVILHYESNRRTTRPGDVVVIDIGAEYHGYSADVTRTIPVSGAFSDEQRAVYDLVHRAQQAGIEATLAGAPFFAPHRAAEAVLMEGMADLGLIEGGDDRRGLRRFFMHGTSHYLGLDVHDTGTRGPLRPGMVITVEPGIYISPAEDIDPRWWNIGVRIEDDVLVTEGGPEVLSAAAPRSSAEVEALVSGGGM